MVVMTAQFTVLWYAFCLLLLLTPDSCATYFYPKPFVPPPDYVITPYIVPDAFPLTATLRLSFPVAFLDP
jgi:hypothetical protein